MLDIIRTRYQRIAIIKSQEHCLKEETRELGSQEVIENLNHSTALSAIGAL